MLKKMQPNWALQRTAEAAADLYVRRLMKPRAIEKIVIEPSGKLLVCPRLSEDRSTYEYIYREANGLRWDRQMKALHAHEPLRWQHEELLQHMATALRECCDEDLVFNQETQWVGVPPELQEALRKVLIKGPHLERNA